MQNKENFESNNNRSKDNPCTLEDNTMQKEQNLEDMMETDRPIQDARGNLVWKRLLEVLLK